MYYMFNKCTTLQRLTLGEKFIITTPTDITITTGYTKDVDGNKIGGTTNDTYIIKNMFTNCSSLQNVYVTDETTRNILKEQYNIVRSKRFKHIC